MSLPQNHRVQHLPRMALAIDKGVNANAGCTETEYGLVVFYFKLRRGGVLAVDNGAWQLKASVLRKGRFLLRQWQQNGELMRGKAGRDDHRFKLIPIPQLGSIRWQSISELNFVKVVVDALVGAIKGRDIFVASFQTLLPYLRVGSDKFDSPGHE